MQCTIDQPTHDLLRRAQALLGHTVPAGDMGQMLNRALALLVTQLEKRRFGSTERPRACRRRSDGAPRAIPAAVRRQVWERDGGRCTFVGDGGHVCGSREGLEFDHVRPVARGGEATPSNLRLRCRAHNHHEAERAYGHEFMRHQREQARREREAARERIDELVPALRNLGLSLADARLAAARAADLPPDSTLEQRLRFVLKTLMPRGTVRLGPVTATAVAPSGG